jgi:hypothetical protein
MSLGHSDGFRSISAPLKHLRLRVHTAEPISFLLLLGQTQGPACYWSIKIRKLRGIESEPVSVAVPARLKSEQSGVAAVQGQQLGVRAALGHPTLVEDHDLVGQPNC